MTDHYKRISSSYNWLSRVYSLGAVGRCRRFVLTLLEPEMKLCFLGVGEGEEAIEALKMGARVTVVDSSEAMLDRFQNALLALDSASRARAEVFHGDVRSFCEAHGAEFDLVVCHFFLNVFDPKQMPKMLEKLSRLIAPGGKIVIGDFWYDKSAPLSVRLLQKAYWNIALFIFTKIVKNAKHPVYIYDDLLEGIGLSVIQQQKFKVLGAPMYRSVVAELKDLDVLGK